MYGLRVNSGSYKGLYLLVLPDGKHDHKVLPVYSFDTAEDASKYAKHCVLDYEVVKRPDC